MMSGCNKMRTEPGTSLKRLTKQRRGSMDFTKEVAERSLYIDFEGNEGASPTLIGVYVEHQGVPTFIQYVLEEQFQDLTGVNCSPSVQAAEVIAKDLHATLRIIAEQAKRENRQCPPFRSI